MKPGLFVSFEGIEGCGKTTQIALLAERLETEGTPVLVTREPGGTRVGDGIRQIVLDSKTVDLTAEAELLLFYASRRQNIAEKILPALARGDVVISDRFYDASMAYQGFGRGLSTELISRLTDLVCRQTRPDVTILLDIDPGTGLSRARRRNAVRGSREGRFEDEDPAFYERVRAGYLELASREPDRIRIVPAGGTVDAVAGRIHAVLDAVAAR
jgi:dTMP kinase